MIMLLDTWEGACSRSTRRGWMQEVKVLSGLRLIKGIKLGRIIMGWWLRGYYVTRVWLELICASIWWLSLERKCEIGERWG